jgi:hypothetical protein
MFKNSLNFKKSMQSGRHSFTEKITDKKDFYSTWNNIVSIASLYEESAIFR